jgi:hypothetical protein
MLEWELALLERCQKEVQKKLLAKYGELYRCSYNEFAMEYMRELTSLYSDKFREMKAR